MICWSFRVRLQQDTHMAGCPTPGQQTEAYLLLFPKSLTSKVTELSAKCYTAAMEFRVLWESTENLHKKEIISGKSTMEWQVTLTRG